MDREKYLAATRGMLAGSGGSYPAVTLVNYLFRLSMKFGDAFDPLRALDELIEAAQLLRKEIDESR